MTSTAGRTTLAAQLEMYSSNGSVAQTDFSHRIVAHIRGHPKSVRHRSNSLKGNKRFSSLPDVTKIPLVVYIQFAKPVWSVLCQAELHLL